MRLCSVSSQSNRDDGYKQKPDTKRSVARTMIATVLQEHRRGEISVSGDPQKSLGQAGI